VNRHGLWLVLMPGRNLLLLSARLSSGVPRSTGHRGREVWRCFLANMFDGCFFLMCDKVLVPTDYAGNHAELLAGGGDVPLSAISALTASLGSIIDTLPLTGGYANANDFEVRLRALTCFAKD
jgi:hypothetical protein